MKSTKLDRVPVSLSDWMDRRAKNLDIPKTVAYKDLEDTVKTIMPEFDSQRLPEINLREKKNEKKPIFRF